MVEALSRCDPFLSWKPNICQVDLPLKRRGIPWDVPWDTPPMWFFWKIYGKIRKNDLVGGFKHEFYCSTSYMGCHPKPIDELIFFKMVIAPPTSDGNHQVSTVNPALQPTDPTGPTVSSILRGRASQAGLASQWGVSSDRWLGCKILGQIVRPRSLRRVSCPIGIRSRIRS